MMFQRLKEMLSGQGSSWENSVEQPDDLKLAVAVLLLEAARSDGDFSEEEREDILDALHYQFQLSDEESAELVQMASVARDQSLDIYPYTRKLNEALKREERREILEEVWRVIYSDGKLDANEDHLVHIMARLLNLSHEELIAAKLTVLRELKDS